MSKTVNIDDDAYEKVAEFAKKDRRAVRQELMLMVDFAYENMHNKTLQMINAMAPQKGMTIEEVKASPKYKELEEQLAALKKEAWDIADRDNITMDELVRLSNENKAKQDEIQDQMRAMLNVQY